MKNWLKKYWNEISLTGIFTIAIILRIYAIFSRELWYDEAFSGLIIENGWKQMTQMLSEDVHPPLYYALLKLWASIFGNYDFVIRSFSLLANMALLALVYIFFKKHIKEKTLALTVLLLLAVNPYLVLYSAEARMYSLFGLLYFLAFMFFYKGTKEDKRIIPWLLFALFYALCFYTHYISVLGTDILHSG